MDDYRRGYIAALRNTEDAIMRHIATTWPMSTSTRLHLQQVRDAVARERVAEERER